MADPEDWLTAIDALRLAAQLMDGIQEGVVSRGFKDVRPSYAFAFERIGAGEATIGDVAVHIGVSKQAGARLVQQLEQRGYVSRRTHPLDSRAVILSLTKRGAACAGAAEGSATETVERWRTVLGEARFGQLQQALRAIVESGPLPLIS
jgi:DNA-binding MarR family transcriptional regulator